MTKISRVRWAMLLALVGGWFAAVPGSAQELDPQAVAARVDGFEIRVADVQRVMSNVLGGRQVQGDARPLLAQALEQLIQRRLVEQRLKREGIEVSDAELAPPRQELERKLAASKRTLEQFLAQQHLTEAQLEDQMRWEVAWAKYLQQSLTPDRLRAVYEASPRQFDGTRLRASHILFRIAPANDPLATQQTIQRALAIRQQIVAGTITFAEAAEQYSDGPSRAAGGDLGWIPRHDLMVESFSAALFALDEGEISQPVVTPFGIHLIQCTGVQPGQLPPDAVRAHLIPVAAQQRFNELAAEERSKAKIEYTGLIPPVPASNQ